MEYWSIFAGLYLNYLVGLSAPHDVTVCSSRKVHTTIKYT